MTSLSPLRKNSTSTNLSRRFISGLEKICFRQQQQLGVEDGWRIAALARGPISPDDLEKLALLVLEHDHVERQLHDGAQIGVVPGLANEPVDLGLVDRAHGELGVGVAREHDAQDLWMAPPDVLEQIETRHPGHVVVADQELYALLAQDLQRLLPARGHEDGVAGVAEDPAQRSAHVIFVVDDEDRPCRQHVVQWPLRVWSASLSLLSYRALSSRAPAALFLSFP